MQNNVILRRLRYTFDFNDDTMIKLFGLGGEVVDRAQISDWLKGDDDPDHVKLHDSKLAVFLNGLIVMKRGKKDGPPMVPEKQLNNNIIFRKLKIALNLKDTDIIDIYDRVDMHISKHELSAIFRKPGQKQYRQCKDQFLRNFLYGLQFKERPESKSDQSGDED